MIQLITPDPHIPCQPGWCLQYVRQAFGLPARHPTATAAWEASTSQHRDRDFPPGVWLPVWFSLADEPAGHVALMAPDGSVFSTSDLGSVPHQHPDLSDLMNYYARYGMTLKYLGWTEDVAGYPVITDAGIAAQGAITPLSSTDASGEDDFLMALSQESQAGMAKNSYLNLDSNARIEAQNRAILETLGLILPAVARMDTRLAENVDVQGRIEKNQALMLDSQAAAEKLAAQIGGK